MVRKNTIRKQEKYMCKSCGMEFFKPLKKSRNKEKKGLICPYCGSELYHDLIIEKSLI